MNPTSWPVPLAGSWPAGRLHRSGRSRMGPERSSVQATSLGRDHPLRGRSKDFRPAVILLLSGLTAYSSTSTSCLFAAGPPGTAGRPDEPPEVSSDQRQSWKVLILGADALALVAEV